MNWEQYEAFSAMGQRNTQKLSQTPQCPICGLKFYCHVFGDGFVIRACPKGHETKTELEVWEPPS